MLFSRDMQDQASVNPSLSGRFGWNVIESAPAAGRKIFNTACEKYEKWLRSEGSQATAEFSKSSVLEKSTLSFMSPISIAHTPSTSTTASEPVAKAQANQRKRSNSHTAGLRNHDRLSALTPLVAQKSTDTSTSVLSPSSAAPAPSIPPAIPPTQRISRTTAVFIAWKAEEPVKS